MYKKIIFNVFSESTEPVKKGNGRKTVSRQLPTVTEHEKKTEEKMTIFKKMRVKIGN